MQKSIPELISNTRKSQNMSLRAFAEALSEPLKERGGEISHQQIKNWEKGKYLPSYFWMISLAMACTSGTNETIISDNGKKICVDWRFKLAIDILAILKPNLWRHEVEPSLSNPEPV